jgi:hypothetical protein
VDQLPPILIEIVICPALLVQRAALIPRKVAPQDADENEGEKAGEKNHKNERVHHRQPMDLQLL